MRYPGGKGKTYQHIINVMPPHRVYIETHLGGGAVMRNKLPAERNIGIETDARTFALWVAQEVSNLELVHGRAEDFLTQYEFVGDEVVYSDPPYHPQTRKQSRVYSQDYSVEDHERLISILKSLPCKVILSGYENRLYQAVLSGWRTRSYLAKTHTGVRKETLWFNFDLSQDLHDTRYLGENFRARQAIKRRLQRLKKKIDRMDPIERRLLVDWLNDAYPSNSLDTTQ